MMHTLPAEATPGLDFLTFALTNPPARPANESSLAPAQFRTRKNLRGSLAGLA